MAENNIKIIKHTITRLLARREHSKSELFKKLIERDFEPDECRQWIAKFCESNIQSDQRFTESLIRTRTGKGVGQRRILQELKEHDIDPDVIANMFKEAQIDWFELAKKVFIKRFSEEAGTDWKARQKQQRFMYYRGFSQEQISYALESVEK
ncbi:recombination regulator RecX [Paraglaciecola aquimarina]|uniref:Regulatory protein RecX n=1 Tax=Paraglaciecola algarum TaxID=3050085 RepID=A0ABS9DB56_9ALTE|nr:regulatory protein RecX [Paraglaciecola sp. G1-23]MCF2950187.1 recombination regulator RecX [Paraglaciecola sp. G1-23]